MYVLSMQEKQWSNGKKSYHTKAQFRMAQTLVNIQIFVNLFVKGSTLTQRANSF